MGDDQGVGGVRDWDIRVARVLGGGGDGWRQVGGGLQPGLGRGRGGGGYERRPPRVRGREGRNGLGWGSGCSRRMGNNQGLGGVGKDVVASDGRGGAVMTTRGGEEKLGF